MAEAPIRICIPIEGTFDGIYGGGQVYVRNLANALYKNGHDVTVLECVQVSNAGGGDETLSVCADENSVRLVRLHLPSGRGWGNQRQVKAALREGIAAAAPDLVHANGMKALVARVCAEMRIPCVVTVHHGGLVCPAGTLLDDNDEICRRPVSQKVCARCCINQQPLAPLWRLVLAFTPIWLQLTVGRYLRRIPMIPYVTPALTVPLQVYEKRLEVEELLSMAWYIVAPSKAMQAALLLNGSRAERTVFIPHGIPALGKTTFQPQPGRRVVRFAYVGRLNRVKGLHVLIRAFNRLSGDVELHILGNAKTKGEKRYWDSVLKEVARPERVIQHGYLIGPDYWRTVGRCDAVILPSIFLEVFGLTIAEAFSIGRPVITTDSGGPGEQVTNGLDGYVVAPNNVSELADAMQKFADDPEKALVFANNIRDPNSIEQHVDALVGLYSRCLSPNEAS